MKNKYYKELEKKYGKSIYDLFKHFVSVKIFVNEGKEKSYVKTVIAYPHYKLDFSKENLETLEMIDIISGKKYPLISDAEIREECFTKKHVSQIDENLFNREMKKDENGSSIIMYDVKKFDKTIKQMGNFILTTQGTSKLDEFKRLEYTPEEIELEKKHRYIFFYESLLPYIKIAVTCNVPKIDDQIDGKRRKGKVRFNLAKTNVPVFLAGKKAINLLDGKTEYPILEYETSNNKYFKRLLLTDDSYDMIYNDILNGNNIEYIDSLGNIRSIAHQDIPKFTSTEFGIIFANVGEIYEKEKQKKLTK